MSPGARDWRDISYLLEGGERQRQAHAALQAIDILAALREFDPVLVGTIALDVDVPSSDLDIICKIDEPAVFERTVRSRFGHLDGFRMRRRGAADFPGVVGEFRSDGFVVEVFGERQLVERQHAYRHHVVEARLLQLGGEEARERIRALKASGLKTEPAFAKYFGIAGDPYHALLELGELTDEELASILNIG